MSELNIHTRSTCHGSRAGFTLVEMMVVIVIIGILSALTAVGVSKVIGNQRVSNTEGAIRTIQKTLSEHWAAVVNDAKKETGLSDSFASIDAVFGPDNTGGDRNRVIWIKMRLMEAFPVSFAEIRDPYPYKPQNIGRIVAPIIPVRLRKYNSTYNKALAAVPLAQRGNTKPITESAACLLMALSITRSGASLNVDNMGSINTGDTDNDGVPEFIDSWGNPLSFYRFPTHNKALQDSNPANAKFADPLDPGGALFSLSGNVNFENNVHKVISPFNASTACYIVPTIVSWGPDGDIHKENSFKRPYGLGLDDNIPGQAMAITDFKDPNSDFKHQEADNIYSFKLR